MNKLLLFLCITFLPFVISAQGKVELVVQSGHYEEIKSLAFSPNGKYLASGADDGKIIIWDLKTGKIFRELKGHTRSRGVLSLLFTKDGSKLISGGDGHDKQLIVWDWKTGKIIWKKEKANSNDIGAIALSHNEKLLATGTYHQLRMWDFETGELVYELKYDRNLPEDQIINHNVESIIFSADDSQFAFAAYGKGVMIRNTSDGKFLRLIKTKEEQSLPISIAWGGKSEKDVIYVSGSISNTSKWNYKTGKFIEKFECNGSGTGGSIVFSPDMNHMVIGNMGDLIINDLKTNSMMIELRDFWWRGIEAVAISKDSKYIAVSGEDENENLGIKIINLKTQSVIHKLSGYANSITSVDINKKNSRLAVGSQDRYARVWDLTTSAGFVNYSDNMNYPGDIYADVRFSNNDRDLIMGAQNTFNVWNTESRKHIKYAGYGGKRMNHLAISPNGKLMAQNAPRLFETDNYEKLIQMKSPRLSSKAITFSKDGKLLYGGGFKEIKVYDVAKMEVKEIIPIKAGYVQEVIPLKDEFIIENQGDILLVDNKTGEKIKKIADKRVLPKMSPDGKNLILVDNRKHIIYVHDPITYEVKHEMIGHEDRISSLSFSPDGKILASGSFDTRVILWDVEKGKQIATLLALDEEEYIIVTPDNYYMTSKNGVNGVAFRVGTKIFPFEQFDLHYNRPDIILKRIGLASADLIDAYRRSYDKRLKKIGFAAENLSKEFHVPDIEITNSEDISIETSKTNLSINLKASDSKYTLNRIMVWNNDVPIFGMKGIDLTKTSTKELIRKLDIPLVDGRNKIQVAVMNDNGVESFKETVEISKADQNIAPKLYILSIGASEFNQDQYNLTYAGKDAGDIVDAFTLSQVFSEVNSKVLIGKEVTRDNILKQKAFLEEAGINDVVLVFIAGHGVLDGNFDYFFATSDMDFNAPSKAGISYAQIESLLDGLTSIKKLLFMDTCHSGELDKDEVEEDMAMEVTSEDVVFRAVGVGVRTKEGIGSYNTSTLMKELFTDLRRGTGATVISSAGGAEFAMESDKWKNGLFTYCLINGLKSDAADVNDDRKIQLSELQNYVIKSVSLLSKGKQVPTSRMENLESDYRLW